MACKAHFWLVGCDRDGGGWRVCDDGAHLVFTEGYKQHEKKSVPFNFVFIGLHLVSIAIV